jgi:hypothetical protein
MLNRKHKNRSVWHGKIMQRKQGRATAARNIRIRALERKGIAQRRIGDQ